jgi:hypothetical protein
MTFKKYKAAKLNIQLKSAVIRFETKSKRTSALMMQQHRDIARLLKYNPPKEERASIKAEALIRDKNTIEAYEILQLNCEQLSNRTHLVSHTKECPPDLISCVSTIIWASAIVNIPELLKVRKQLRYKYGKKFISDAMKNVGGVVNERVVAMLSVQPPSSPLVQSYLDSNHHGQAPPCDDITTVTASCQSVVSTIGSHEEWAAMFKRLDEM